MGSDNRAVLPLSPLEVIMRNHSSTMVLSGLLVLTWLGIWVGGPNAKEADKRELQQWEYRDTSLQNINSMGRDGWEVCGVVPGEEGSSAKIILKRPK